MICPQCGSTCPESDLFCTLCGARLHDDAENVDNPFAVGAQGGGTVNGYGGAPDVPYTPLEAIKIVLKKYINSYGRASRSECLLWMLSVIVISGFLFLALVAAGFFASMHDGKGSGLATLLWLTLLLFFAFIFTPTLSVTVRRFHDFNSPSYLLLTLPVTAPFMLPALTLIPGTPGPNKYGAQPVRRQRTAS
ncbi:MAG: DUF805 domain-containing protein [Thermoguttaceae bacterium]|jgi:uncharacterized membrane protein YhaH (DUF805 family)